MATWEHSGTWIYEYYHLDEPAATFPGAENFVELWQQKRANRNFPARTDFDWYELEPWWGSIGISTYYYFPFDYQYSLFGTEYVERFQFDATGKRASDFTQGLLDGGDNMSFYQMVAENGFISRVSGTLQWQDRPHVDVTIVVLPLSDTDIPVTHSIELLL